MNCLSNTPKTKEFADPPFSHLIFAELHLFQRLVKIGNCGEMGTVFLHQSSGLGSMYLQKNKLSRLVLDLGTKQAILLLLLLLLLQLPPDAGSVTQSADTTSWCDPDLASWHPPIAP
jgi:hypothetical protein